MKNGNEWISPPPNWNCIKGLLAESDHNLNEFLEFKENQDITPYSSR